MRLTIAALLICAAAALGQSPPVVLIGGGTTGAASWNSVEPLLAKSHPVIKLENMNVRYGLEARPLPPDYSIETEVRAVRTALEERKFRRVDLIGWSMGALIALNFALESPARVRTLTLIEPPAFWLLPNHGRDDEEARRMQDLVRTFNGNDITEDQLRQFRCALGDCAGAKSPLMIRYRRSLLGLHAVGENQVDPRRLRQLTMPVLIVTGTNTVAFHKRINQLLLSRLPNGHSLHLRGGHNSFQVEPDKFVGAWISFQAAAH